MPRIKKEKTETMNTSTDAINNPVITRKMTESQEQDIGQIGTREFKENHELTASTIEVANQGVSKKYLDEMAFMNEIVTVRLHESTDKNANPFPEVFVNGRVQRFIPGQDQQVRRCYVEALARAKQTVYDNVKTKGSDGEDKYIYPSRTAPIYPFTVIGDSAKGDVWLKKILAEAN